MPGSDIVKKMTVWLRHLGLPIAFWITWRLMGIVEEADEPISIDEFTDQLRKTGFARIQVEIDATMPLKPGVLVKGKNRVFSQGFVYENLPVVCFRCGRNRIGHPDVDCKEVADHPLVGLSASNVMEDRMETQLSPVMGPRFRLVVRRSGSSWLARPRFGPWIVTSKIRPPRSSAPVRGKKVQSEGAVLGSVPGSAGNQGSLPSSPPDSDGRQKPVKVARWRSPDLVMGHQESPDTAMGSPIQGRSSLLQWWPWRLGRPHRTFLR